MKNKKEFADQLNKAILIEDLKECLIYAFPFFSTIRNMDNFIDKIMTDNIQTFLDIDQIVEEINKNNKQILPNLSIISENNIFLIKDFPLFKSIDKKILMISLFIVISSIKLLIEEYNIVEIKVINSFQNINRLGRIKKNEILKKNIDTTNHSLILKKKYSKFRTIKKAYIQEWQAIYHYRILNTVCKNFNFFIMTIFKHLYAGIIPPRPFPKAINNMSNFDKINLKLTHNRSEALTISIHTLLTRYKIDLLDLLRDFYRPIFHYHENNYFFSVHELQVPIIEIDLSRILNDYNEPKYQFNSELQYISFQMNWKTLTIKFLEFPKQTETYAAEMIVSDQNITPRKISISIVYETNNKNIITCYAQINSIKKKYLATWTSAHELCEARKFLPPETAIQTENFINLMYSKYALNVGFLYNEEQYKLFQSTYLEFFEKNINTQTLSLRELSTHSICYKEFTFRHDEKNLKNENKEWYEKIKSIKHEYQEYLQKNEQDVSTSKQKTISNDNQNMYVAWDTVVKEERNNPKASIYHEIYKMKIGQCVKFGILEEIKKKDEALYKELALKRDGKTELALGTQLKNLSSLIQEANDFATKHSLDFPSETRGKKKLK